MQKPEKIESALPEFEIALEAAVMAGKEIMKVYANDFSTKTKKDDSPITLADIKSNNAIKEILLKTGIKILSEEDKDDKNRLYENRVWIVDPLDGTTDFVKRTGEFTIMIGLVERGKPILGVISWPTESIIFAAQRRCGAWIFSNNSWKRIFVSNVSELKQCRAVASRHHIVQSEMDFLKKLKITTFRSMGSSLKVAQISSGEAEVYLTTTNKMKEWDTCASYCIVTEAGGRMTDMAGNDLTYNKQEPNHLNGILATNGLVHDDIVREFQKLQ